MVSMYALKRRKELTSGRPCKFGNELDVAAAARNSADCACAKTWLVALFDMHRRTSFTPGCDELASLVASAILWQSADVIYYCW